jgi:bifunctional UDP-N-acetylglucosamine pyrophosphorylase/glucosamine-1-phosphate N-acetyltransferase
MTQRKTAAILLAAGLGTRMRSERPKALHPLGGLPMVDHEVATVSRLGLDRLVVVVGEGMEDVAARVRPHKTVIQGERLGTAHAVLAARDAFKDFDGDILVIYVDTPLIRPETLQRMLAARRAEPSPAVVVLGFRPEEPGSYGRLVVNAQGGLEAIVEAKDATPEQLTIGLCNSGVIAVDGARLWSMLSRIGNSNAKKEFYLTDLVTVARADGLTASVVEGDPEELCGVNSRSDLAAAEAILQARMRAAATDGGATLIDPATVYFSGDTKLGRDVLIEPNVFFGPGVTVGDNVTIKAFSHIDGATIEAGAIVGPFARLRPGARIGREVHIGNFVEVKNAVIEDGAKANHLSYIGDSRVGKGANIGAGTITCNYDGFEKHRTDIGAGAFIGSDVCLVAPVKVGDGAVIGAGSVITEEVPKDALVLTRPPVKKIDGWAVRNREKKTKRKKGA